MIKILIATFVLLAIGLGFAVFSRLSDGRTIQLNKEVTADLTSLIKASASDQQTALEVVNAICQSYERNDRERLANLVTKMPEAYWKVYTEAGRRNMGDSFVENKEKSKNTLSVITPNLKKFSSKDEMVTFIFGSSEKVNELEEKFVEVVELKQNKNEAKAKVRFKTLPDFEDDYEILLYQEADGWKAFHFGHPDSYAEKWAVDRDR